MIEVVSGIFGGLFGPVIASWLARRNLALVFCVGFILFPGFFFVAAFFWKDLQFAIAETKIIVAEPLFVAAGMLLPGLCGLVLALLGRHGRKKSPHSN